MQHRSLWMCALVSSLMACGGDDGGDGIGGLFEALHGDYQVREESDCVIEIRGSRFGTRTSAGETTCEEVYEDGEREMLEVSGTLSDTRITGTLINDESWPLNDTDPCPLIEGNRREATMTVEKLSGRSEDGRFEGIAGTWEGELTITESGFTRPCDGPEEIYQSRVSPYTFTADVRGNLLSVTYENQDGDVDDFEVVSSSSGDLVIEGEVVHFAP